MSITISGPTFDDPEEQLLTELQNLVDNVARHVCENHYEAYTQEPATTARLAQAIEMALERHPINVDGLAIEVATQDMPDRGSRMEKLIGGDLYISLVRRDKDVPVSKGMLAQAKWDTKLESDPLLEQQAARMHRRSKESYVLVYGPHDVLAVPASSIIGTVPEAEIVTVGELIASGLRCTRGDEKIGRDLNRPRPQSMNAMLDRLHAEAVLEFAVDKK